VADMTSPLNGSMNHKKNVQILSQMYCGVGCLQTKELNMIVTEVNPLTMNSPTPAPRAEADRDELLIKRFFSNRDPQAIEELFHRHANSAYRLALADLENAADAEEAVQAAFLHILTGGPKEIRSVRGWIMRIVADKCRDKIKEEARRRARQEAAA